MSLNGSRISTLEHFISKMLYSSSRVITLETEHPRVE